MLSSDRTGQIHEQIIEQQRLPVAANARIYLGAMVSINGDGYVEPAALGAAQSDKAVFFALESVRNPGAAGAKHILCMTRGTILVPRGSLAVADLGKWAYLVDDESVTITENDHRVGRITNLSGALAAISL